MLFVGETSAGKSTLINKILQKNIFQGHTEESTSTICKIRNLEGVKIIAKCNDGSTRSMDLSKDCEMSTESGVEMLRKTLTALTDMVVSAGSVNFEYVDVGFPIPFLKVFTCELQHFSITYLAFWSTIASIHCLKCMLPPLSV